MEKFKQPETGDLELVLSWIQRFKNLAEYEKGNDAKEIYLKEAKKILETRDFTDPIAKEMLEAEIKKYEV
jgi:hypothetical protein